MSASKDQIMTALTRITLPDGGDLVSRDMVRALTIEGDRVQFLLEVPADKGAAMEPVRKAAEDLVAGLEGVGVVILALHQRLPGHVVHAYRPGTRVAAAHSLSFLRVYLLVRAIPSFPPNSERLSTDDDDAVCVHT